MQSISTTRQAFEKAHAETDRVLAHLRDLIEDSDLPRYEIEERAGFSRGYLAQILAGRVRLKLSHLAAILQGIDASFASFFGDVFPTWPLRDGRSPRSPAVNREVVSVFGYGLESIHDFRRRIARCEHFLGELQKHGKHEEP